MDESVEHIGQCEAPKIAKFVYKSNNYMFMVFIAIVTGAYKQT